eukprot:Skav214578  [mRNA]  locus=scaffold57:195327:199849:+ [translate_table: standard]
MDEATSIEPRVSDAATGTCVDLVVDTKCILQNTRTMAVTKLTRQLVFLDFVVDAPVVTIFQGVVCHDGPAVIIQRTANTRVYAHQTDFRRCIEACAGIAAVTQGYQACGIRTDVHVEENYMFATWLNKHGKPVIQGDISDSQVQQQITGRRVFMLAGGMSCQPFSYLGDGRQAEDPRSKSFPAMLKAQYMTQTPVLVLECTPAAFESPWVQNTLAQYSAQSGYVVQQRLLDISPIWPSKRKRWWCTVTHPELGVQPVPDFPAMPFAPSLNHLFPAFMQLNEQETKQLELDTHELREFYTRPDLHKHAVNCFKQLPTATHSWGSQVKGCPCKCRANGFSESRLNGKGLYGQVVALANGCNPKDLGQPEANLRLELAGIGQRASPLQGAWVVSHLIKDVHQRFMFMEHYQDPVKVVQSIMQDLLKVRDQMFQAFLPTKPTDIFRDAIQSWGATYMPIPQDTPRPPTLTETARVQIQPEKRVFANNPVSHPEHAPMETAPEPARPEDPPTMCRARRMGGLFASGFPPNQDTPKEPSASQESMDRHLTTWAAEQASGETPDSEKAPPTADTASVQEPPPGTPETQTMHPHIQVAFSDSSVMHMSIREGSTVGQLNQAMLALQMVSEPVLTTTAMGTPMPLQMPLQQGMIVQTQCIHDEPKWKDAQGTITMPYFAGHTREVILWNQRGWVAHDEMQHYMYMVECSHPGTTVGTVVIPPTADANIQLARLLLQTVHAVQAFPENEFKTMMILYGHHWFPLVAVKNQHGMEVRCPSDQVGLVRRSMIEAWGGEKVQITGWNVESQFPFDCGFQAIGFVTGVVTREESPCTFTVTKACEWRSVFHQQLLAQSRATDMVMRPLIVGGTQALVEELSGLVSQHGVHPSRSQECAEQLLQSLGPQSVAQALKSPQPWADLKAKASSHHPPLRIVLASELKIAVEKRAKQGKSVGSKQNKMKQSIQQKHVQLRTDQVILPTGVFTTHDGDELTHIGADQLGPRTKGMIIATFAEAQPLLSAKRPISHEGMGLIILDPTMHEIPQPYTLMQVPMQCKATGEPLLVRSALIQLGAKPVQRAQPSTCVAVPEVPNLVVRVLVYRDQCQQSWDALLSGPVKGALQQEPLSQLTSADIIDVWDRQFVSQRFVKAAGKDADILIFNMRLHSAVADRLCTSSGVGGIYLEPRSCDGRSPSSAHQVVWLPGKSFSEAKLAQQLTEAEVVLVRAGNRYGLRATNQDAEGVHKAHRPDLVFLPSVDLRRCRVGPMPYGTTKQSVVTVLNKLSWASRPVGPIGQAGDGSGTMWVVQAPAPPSHWVWNLQHGDVLISPMEETSTTTQKKLPTVMASAKTMQCLQRKDDPIDKSQTDPWLHQDPWAGNTRTKEASVNQVAAIEASVEQRVLAKLKDDDVQMSDTQTSRVQELEQQVEHLHNAVESMQKSQHQQNVSLQNQLETHAQCIHKLDQKVDAQQAAFASTLDTKLADQMTQIDALLSKRFKTT